MMMTLNDMLGQLQNAAQALPVVFTTSAGPIGAGYHVTELKAARINSIDCSGNLDDWTEAAVQLLDGASGQYMTAGKLVRILEHSITQVSGLGDAPVHVEFAHGNKNLQRFEMSLPIVANDRVEVSLLEAVARCKPAARAAITTTSAGCCA